MEQIEPEMLALDVKGEGNFPFPILSVNLKYCRISLSFSHFTNHFTTKYIPPQNRKLKNSRIDQQITKSQSILLGKSLDRLIAPSLDFSEQSADDRIQDIPFLPAPFPELCDCVQYFLEGGYPRLSHLISAESIIFFIHFPNCPSPL